VKRIIRTQFVPDAQSLKLLRSLIREVISGNMRGSRRFEIPSNMRYGEQIVGHTGGNVLSDEDAEQSDETQKLALKNMSDVRLDSESDE
jgi:hypothetical protein